jgi:hypothetical protein
MDTVIIITALATLIIYVSKFLSSVIVKFVFFSFSVTLYFNFLQNMTK